MLCDEIAFANAAVRHRDARVIADQRGFGLAPPCSLANIAQAICPLSVWLPAIATPR